MKTKLTMQMPEALGDARHVEITGVVILPNSEYQDIIDNGNFPDRYLDRLNQYTGAVTPHNLSDIFKYNALLVLDEDGENGIAVCGKNHFSYAGQFPGAKEWLDNRISHMADYICELSHVPGAKLPYRLDMKNLGKIFDTTVTADNGTGELLLKELQSRQEITDIIMMEDCFEINYYLDHVPETVGPGERIMTLMGLIGCNLEDVHLCHADEDHDLATVVELNDNTLTEQGKEDWSDVLNAKVERIYNGDYGTQIALSGCEADRLRDFSYMLAGYVEVSDYDKWVNDGGLYDNQPEDSDTPDEDESSGMTMQ